MYPACSYHPNISSCQTVENAASTKSMKPLSFTIWIAASFFRKYAFMAQCEMYDPDMMALLTRQGVIDVLPCASLGVL